MDTRIKPSAGTDLALQAKDLQLLNKLLARCYRVLATSIEGQSRPAAFSYDGSNDEEPGIAAVISVGDKLFKDGKFDVALQAYSQAVVLCPCYAESLKSCTKIGVSLDVAISLVLQNFPCSCKNWSEATKDVKGLGLYKLAKSPCTCGASQSRQCKSSHHLKALDGQAAAYTETGKLDAACRTAERMLQMAPTELDAYYRYQKVLRRRDPQSTLAVLVVKQSVQMASKFRKSHHRLFKILFELKERLQRQDPKKRFPQELMSLVFEQLDIRDVLACMRVCRTWYDAVLGTYKCFTNLDFGTDHVPKLDGLRQIFRRANMKVTDITFHNIAHSNINHRAMRLILRLPELQHLSLAIPTLARNRVNPLQYDFEKKRLSVFSRTDILEESALQNLTTLHLEGFLTMRIRPILPGLIARLPAGLKSLSIVGTPLQMIIPGTAPPLLQLENIRLVSVLESWWHRDLDLSWLVIYAPNVRQVFLDGFLLYRTTDFSPPRGAWSNLEALVLGERVDLVRDDRRDFAASFPEMPRLKMLDILTRKRVFSLYSATPMSSWNTPDSTWVRREHPCLESFRYLGDFPGDFDFDTFFDTKNRRNFQLHTFEITHHTAELFMPTLQRFQDTITTVGMHDFRYDSGSYHGSTGLPFVDWVRTFPNVHTVSAYPEHFPEAGATIGALLDIPRVKTIYQDCLIGMARDEVVTVANQRGVQVIHARNYRPVEWPYTPAHVE